MFKWFLQISSKSFFCDYQFSRVSWNTKMRRCVLIFTNWPEFVKINTNENFRFKVHNRKGEVPTWIWVVFPAKILSNYKKDQMINVFTLGCQSQQWLCRIYKIHNLWRLVGSTKSKRRVVVECWLCLTIAEKST